MSHDEATSWTVHPSDALRVGDGFRLADLDPDSTPGYTGKKADGAADLEEGAPFLDALQERLYAASVGGEAKRRRAARSCRRWTPPARAASCAT